MHPEPLEPIFTKHAHLFLLWSMNASKSTVVSLASMRLLVSLSPGTQCPTPSQSVGPQSHLRFLWQVHRFPGACAAAESNSICILSLPAFLSRTRFPNIHCHRHPTAMPRLKSFPALTTLVRHPS